MKTKIKTLKTDIDRYYPILSKKYPIVKMIVGAIDNIFKKEMEDELIVHWYSSVECFVKDIQKEIKKIEEENFSIDAICSFKDQMDVHYVILKKNYNDVFIMVYGFITLLIEEKKLSDELKESYKNIYSSVEIIKEGIQEIEKNS